MYTYVHISGYPKSLVSTGIQKSPSPCPSGAAAGFFLATQNAMNKHVLTWCTHADRWHARLPRLLGNFNPDPQRQQRLFQLQSLGLLDWCRQMLPEHFRASPSLMHRWLAGELQSWRQTRGRRVNVIGPRGAAKSTLGTLAYVLRAALERQEPYIWIVSDTRSQACLHLENIKTELLENLLLREAYPAATGRGPVWRQGAIVLSNGVAIDAFGTLQRMRGRRRREHRPTLIVCDDLQNDQHVHSPHLREQTRHWFAGALLKAGDGRTNILNLATALHRDALALELARTPGWVSRTFRAIEQWPANTQLWEQWEKLYADVETPDSQRRAREFYQQHREQMDAGAVLLWPEREDLYSLMCLQAEGGRVAFAREKQGSPLSPDVCEWPESYFHQDAGLWFDAWPDELTIRILALDPSKGRDARRGDFSAYVLLGIDRQGVVYVEADLARRPTPQMVADGVAHYRHFRPHAFGLEANQYQDLLAGEFEAEFRRHGLHTVRPWLVENSVNKLVRIRRLSPLLAAGRLRFRRNSPGTQMLVNQLKDFPVGDHDDGPDALEMALRLADALLEPPASDGLGDRLPVQ
jgi:predicted phage terminase large subunit-like protein